MINGTSWLVVTKLDVLDELDQIPVCISYKIDGKSTSDAPAQASGYEKIECVYKNLPGWRTSTEGITDYQKLPKPAREYLAFLEKETGAKVGMVSTGPDRNHTILLDEFVSELKTAAKKA
jgi:adenylosuccinate synthase